MKRLRKISSILLREGKNKRPICNDKFTLLPNEVHSLIASHLPMQDKQTILLVNQTLFKAYVTICWRMVIITSLSELFHLYKLGKSIIKNQSMHDYFAEVRFLVFDLWQEMDHGKEISRVIQYICIRERPIIRTVSLRIGAAWNEQVVNSIAALPRSCFVELGIATRRLITLDLYKCSNVKYIHLKVDFGNVAWLATALSKSVETLLISPDDNNNNNNTKKDTQPVLKARDVDLKRVLSTAKYLRKLVVDGICIQSDGKLTWLPESITELTLKRCIFDVYCFEDELDTFEVEEYEVLPQAPSVTKLTVHSSSSSEFAVDDNDDDSDQVFMQFPRLHTLCLISEYGNPLTKLPIDSNDMMNLQCLEFQGYAYSDIVTIVQSTVHKLPSSTLSISTVPNGLWIPRESLFQDIISNFSNLKRTILDCSSLDGEKLPFNASLRNAIIQLLTTTTTFYKPSTTLVLNYNKNNKKNADSFAQLLSAGGVEIEVELNDPDTVPPMARIVSVQSKELINSTVLVTTLL